MSDKKLDSPQLPCQLSSLSLAVGFLLIWTFVLSALLLNNSYQYQADLYHAKDLFDVQKDVSFVIFSLGHEMVSTVDWMLRYKTSTEKILKARGNINEGISITWKMTDNRLNDIRFKENIDEKLKKTLEIVSIRLNRFRTSSLFVRANSFDIIHFYFHLSQFLIEKCSGNLSLRAQYSHSSIFSNSFEFFNSGMSKRFAEISIGTYYVRTTAPINQSEYLYLYYTSKHELKIAFSFNHKTNYRYNELIKLNPEIQESLSKITEDILNGNLNRGNNRLASIYITGAKEEIATLLYANDILNSILDDELEDLLIKIHNRISFHLSLAIIAFVSIILCLLLIFSNCLKSNKVCYSFKKNKKSEDGNILDKEVNDQAFYSLSTSDKTMIIPSIHHCYF